MSKRSAPALAPIFSQQKKSKPTLVDDVVRKWKMLAWNVAGLRACVKKNGHTAIAEQEADIIFLGETKCKEFPPEVIAAFPDYHPTIVVSEEKNGGYAGVGLLSRFKPIKVVKGIGEKSFDSAGRLLIAEYARFYFVGAYVPNSGRGLVGLEKRGEWEKLMRAKLASLSDKPVIYAGDLNVAHEEIDLANPASNKNKTPGFTDEERAWMTEMLADGYVDTYRHLHPDGKDYSFWSFMGNARARDVGWRLDYFLVNKGMEDKVEESSMLKHVMGSDHCPVIMNITI